MASRRKEAWMWHDIGDNGEELLLNRVHEWSAYNRAGDYTADEQFHAIQVHF